MVSSFEREDEAFEVRLAEERYAAAQLLKYSAPTEQLEAAAKRLMAVEALVAACTKATASTQRIRRRRNAFVWIITAALAFLIVGILAWYPLPSASIRAKLTISGVHFLLADQWKAINLVEATQLDIQNADYFGVPGIGIAPQRASSANLGAAITAASLWISQVELPAGALVFLKSDHTQLDFVVRSGVVDEKSRSTAQLAHVDILVRGEAEVFVGQQENSSKTKTSNANTTGSLRRTLVNVLPLRLVITPKKPTWLMRGLRVNRMVFSEGTSDPKLALNTVSTIESGTLELLDTKRTISLERGDRLVLDGLKIERLEISAGKPIDITMTASATTVTGGPTGFERDLRPSLLEWLYHLGPLQLIWTAAGVLLGTWIAVQSKLKGAERKEST